MTVDVQLFDDETRTWSVAHSETSADKETARINAGLWAYARGLDPGSVRLIPWTLTDPDDIERWNDRWASPLANLAAVTLTFDVAGWTAAQVDALIAEAAAQGEANDDHPTCMQPIQVRRLNNAPSAVVA